MTQIALAVLKKGELYAAGVFTDDGLFASALPRASVDDAIRSVNGKGLPRDESPDKLRVLEAVFAVWEGKDYPGLDKIKLDFSGMTVKQSKVAKTAREIKKGTTVSYGQLAERAGLPNAARFVGNVMANNRHSPFVPCHRVVSSNGLGGFGGGLSLKVKILKREGAFAD
jgi:methylated-DNA-[protein]-cysteine S-methyltransferase